MTRLVSHTVHPGVCLLSNLYSSYSGAYVTSTLGCACLIQSVCILRRIYYEHHPRVFMSTKLHIPTTARTLGYVRIPTANSLRAPPRGGYACPHAHHYCRCGPVGGGSWASLLAQLSWCVWLVPTILAVVVSGHTFRIKSWCCRCVDIVCLDVIWCA